MERSIKGYLYLYLGCDCNVAHADDAVEGTDTILDFDELLSYLQDPDETIITPYLRPLASMTQDEMIELLLLGFPSLKEIGNSFQVYPNEVQRKIKHGTGVGYAVFNKDNALLLSGTLSLSVFSPEQFVWLLKERFDLFDLIKDGLAKELIPEQKKES